MNRFSADDVVRICAEISFFGRKAGYTFKGLPVVQWEFPSIADFARTKIEMLRAISPIMIGALDSASWQRTIDSHTFEIDCRNVTFRLVCRQVLSVPRIGKVGAAEMIHTTQEAYEARLRKPKP